MFGWQWFAIYIIQYVQLSGQRTWWVKMSCNETRIECEYIYGIKLHMTKGDTMVNMYVSVLKR